MNASNAEVSLTLFHGFSPILKSLRISLNALQNSQIFYLIASLPILEDMTWITNGVDTDGAPSLDVPPSAVRPLTSPPFTGTRPYSAYGDGTRHTSVARATERCSLSEARVVVASRRGPPVCFGSGVFRYP